ncbi:cytochrome P450 [Dictyobacter kobayashii]|uniref:cytochrome P450 n=1 Tax=Dictyobacter kobayashii TaxID=2014872 RepID=UPI001C3F9EBA|nr:cytochrome P450 [Dictyobacter kobayashii]
MVTRHAEVKALFSDRRLGRSHPDPEHAPRISNAILLGGPMGNYDTEPADHAQMRALLTPFFSAKRMAALRPRVEEMVDQFLDALATRTPPADLHEALSFPLPVLVICELLGVPFADREQFHLWSTDMADLHDRARATASMNSLNTYMRELVERKRAQPEDDVLSGLCAVGNGTLSNEQIAGLGAGLLFAGHETTVVRIDIGTLLFLTHPDQRQALLSDPELVTTAVEEILRLSNTGSSALPRYAREAIEISNVTIQPGEAVLLSAGAANRDERVFGEPDSFAIKRQSNPHLTFGYGSHFCIGAPLARIELQAVFARLLSRFPTLRLAIPLEDIRFRNHVLTGGLFELPVIW